MKYIYAISVVTENTLRVLQRMAGIFARHRINIEQMTVFETGNKGSSYFNIVIHSDDKTITRVINQLQRIFELIEVKINNKILLLEHSDNMINEGAFDGSCDQIAGIR